MIISKSLKKYFFVNHLRDDYKSQIEKIIIEFDNLKVKLLKTNNKIIAITSSIDNIKGELKTSFTKNIKNIGDIIYKLITRIKELDKNIAKHTSNVNYVDDDVDDNGDDDEKNDKIEEEEEEEEVNDVDLDVEKKKILLRNLCTYYKVISKLMTDVFSYYNVGYFPNVVKGNNNIENEQILWFIIEMYADQINMIIPQYKTLSHKLIQYIKYKNPENSENSPCIVNIINMITRPCVIYQNDKLNENVTFHMSNYDFYKTLIASSKCKDTTNIFKKLAKSGFIISQTITLYRVLKILLDILKSKKEKLEDFTFISKINVPSTYIYYNCIYYQPDNKNNFINFYIYFLCDWGCILIKNDEKDMNVASKLSKINDYIVDNKINETINSGDADKLKDMNKIKVSLIKKDQIDINYVLDNLGIKKGYFKDVKKIKILKKKFLKHNEPPKKNEIIEIPVFYRSTPDDDGGNNNINNIINNNNIINIINNDNIINNNKRKTVNTIESGKNNKDMINTAENKKSKKSVINNNFESNHNIINPVTDVNSKKRPNSENVVNTNNKKVMKDNYKIKLKELIKNYYHNMNNTKSIKFIIITMKLYFEEIDKDYADIYVFNNIKKLCLIVGKMDVGQRNNNHHNFRVLFDYLYFNIPFLLTSKKVINDKRLIIVDKFRNLLYHPLNTLYLYEFSYNRYISFVYPENITKKYTLINNNMNTLIESGSINNNNYDSVFTSIKKLIGKDDGTYITCKDNSNNNYIVANTSKLDEYNFIYYTININSNNKYNVNVWEMFEKNEDYIIKYLNNNNSISSKKPKPSKYFESLEDLLKYYKDKLKIGYYTTERVDETIELENPVNININIDDFDYEKHINDENINTKFSQYIKKICKLDGFDDETSNEMKIVNNVNNPSLCYYLFSEHIRMKEIIDFRISYKTMEEVDQYIIKYKINSKIRNLIYYPRTIRGQPTINSYLRFIEMFGEYPITTDNNIEMIYANCKYLLKKGAIGYDVISSPYFSTAIMNDKTESGTYLIVTNKWNINFFLFKYSKSYGIFRYCVKNKNLDDDDDGDGIIIYISPLEIYDNLTNVMLFMLRFECLNVNTSTTGYQGYNSFGEIIKGLRNKDNEKYLLNGYFAAVNKIIDEKKIISIDVFDDDDPPININKKNNSQNNVSNMRIDTPIEKIIIENNVNDEKDKEIINDNNNNNNDLIEKGVLKKITPEIIKNINSKIKINVGSNHNNISDDYIYFSKTNVDNLSKVIHKHEYIDESFRDDEIWSKLFNYSRATLSKFTSFNKYFYFISLLRYLCDEHKIVEKKTYGVMIEIIEKYIDDMKDNNLFKFLYYPDSDDDDIEEQMEMLNTFNYFNIIKIIKTFVLLNNENITARFNNITEYLGRWRKLVIKGVVSNDNFYHYISFKNSFGNKDTGTYLLCNYSNNLNCIAYIDINIVKLLIIDYTSDGVMVTSCSPYHYKTEYSALEFLKSNDSAVIEESNNDFDKNYSKMTIKFDTIESVISNYYYCLKYPLFPKINDISISSLLETTVNNQLKTIFTNTYIHLNQINNLFDINNNYNAIKIFGTFYDNKQKALSNNFNRIFTSIDDYFVMFMTSYFNGLFDNIQFEYHYGLVNKLYECTKRLNRDDIEFEEKIEMYSVLYYLYYIFDEIKNVNINNNNNIIKLNHDMDSIKILNSININDTNYCSRTELNLFKSFIGNYDDDGDNNVILKQQPLLKYNDLLKNNYISNTCYYHVDFCTNLFTQDNITTCLIAKYDKDLDCIVFKYKSDVFVLPFITFNNRIHILIPVIDIFQSLYKNSNKITQTFNYTGAKITANMLLDFNESGYFYFNKEDDNDNDDNKYYRMVTELDLKDMINILKEIINTNF